MERTAGTSEEQHIPCTRRRVLQDGGGSWMLVVVVGRWWFWEVVVVVIGFNKGEEDDIALSLSLLVGGELVLASSKLTA